MKSLQMSFDSEAVAAVKSPVRDMSELFGGIGKKPLTAIQIKRLLTAQKDEKKQRKEKKEWKNFILRATT